MSDPAAATERSTSAHWNTYYRGLGRDYSLYLYNQQLLDLIEQSLGGNCAEQRVLEIGCGKAKESQELARRGACVFGVDYSADALRLLSSELVRTDSRMAALEADGRRLPFPDQSFDLCFSQGVIEHFTDPQPLLREQFRVLRPGGTLVVEVPNKYTIYTPYKHLLMRLGRWSPGWEREYSPAQLVRTVRQAGFAPTRVIGWDTFTGRAWRKVQKKLGVPERAESPSAEAFRRRLQANPVVVWLTLSLTVVARKP